MRRGQRCIYVRESRTRKIFRKNVRLRDAREKSTKPYENSVRWEMARGRRLRPGRERARAHAELAEFSMESANDKIRTWPFRHTKFQNVSARAFALPLFGDASVTLSRASKRASKRTVRARKRTTPVSRRSQDISIIFSARYLIFMKDSRISPSRRKTLEGAERGWDDCTVYRAKKKNNSGRKGFEMGKSDFKVLFHEVSVEGKEREREKGERDIVV